MAKKTADPMAETGDETPKKSKPEFLYGTPKTGSVYSARVYETDSRGRENTITPGGLLTAK